MVTDARHNHGSLRSEAGYSLLEMIVAITILLIVSSVVFSSTQRLTNVSRSVHNRSEMHSGVRNATELLQQEVGQAGRISLPGTVTLAGAAAAGAATVAVSSSDGMFVGERLLIGTGDTQETVTLTDVGEDTITATFAADHASGEPVSVQGGFSAGIVPTTIADGSTGSVLKIFGDIHGTGQMAYVEYTCDTEGGNLYRNAMAFDADAKPELTIAEVLLANIRPNPDGTPCFTYQEQTVNGTPFIIQVAITLTVETQERDPITGLFQTETKALLNVSPRNVFHVWQLASLNIMNRVQPMPATVEALLGDPE